MNTKIFIAVFLGVFLAIIAAVGVIVALGATGNNQAVKDLERATCRANLQTIANAVMADRVRTRRSDFASSLDEVAAELIENPVCPTGGRYSIRPGVTFGFTVSCTDSDHNAGAPGQPAGYTPGSNDS